LSSRREGAGYGDQNDLAGAEHVSRVYGLRLAVAHGLHFDVGDFASYLDGHRSSGLLLMKLRLHGAPALAGVMIRL
jgi:hypothetical protein